VLHPGETRRAFIWTFIAARMVAYVFAADRSGETPKRVLGNSQGLLQVDGYSGYNHVTTPGKRIRVGCMAHARRYWWAARETAPNEAQHVLDLILELYVVEYDAAEQDILGTDPDPAPPGIEDRRPVATELEAPVRGGSPSPLPGAGTARVPSP